MSYRSERFNRRMTSVEESAAGIDLSKWRVLSDRSAGVERMVREIDRSAAGREGTARTNRDELLFTAEMRLVEAGKRHLIPVLLLIIENGDDRVLSFAKVPRATYFRHREELLDFFE